MYMFLKQEKPEMDKFKRRRKIVCKGKIQGIKITDSLAITFLF